MPSNKGIDTAPTPFASHRVEQSDFGQNTSSQQQYFPGAKSRNMALSGPPVHADSKGSGMPAYWYYYGEKIVLRRSLRLSMNFIGPASVELLERMNTATKSRSRKTTAARRRPTRGAIFDFGSQRQHVSSAQKRPYIVRSSYLVSGLNPAPKKLFSTSHDFVVRQSV
jgi:hypothetical protein